MPCDTQLKQGQTISQRAAEVRAVTATVAQGLASGLIKAVVGPTGAVAFVGLSEEARDRVTDACIYRRVMATGSAMSRLALAKAEQLAGRTVNRQAIAQGHHSHNGGKTWHHGH